MTAAEVGTGAIGNCNDIVSDVIYVMYTSLNSKLVLWRQR